MPAGKKAAHEPRPRFAPAAGRARIQGVSQSTLVLQFDVKRALELKQRLSEGDFEFRPVPHALFSVKGDGIVATLYTSGKLVVQGASPELFVQRFIADSAATTASARASPAAPGDALEDIALIGSDESGKGDYFGPLVVAAVRLEAGQAKALREAQVRDSKTLSDEACLRLGAALRAKFPHAIARLDPPQYNETHRAKGQLNDILADLHARAIRELAQPGIRVLVDKFADAHLLERKLAGAGIRLEQRVRAEANTAVAAASIVARAAFLEALKDLSEESGVDLAKGAGDPVDRAAERFVAIHGRAGLVKVAKLHFKNTQKIRGGE